MKTNIAICLISAALLALTACAGGTSLKTHEIEPSQIRGDKFDLILYGANYPEDIETLAILDTAGDDYEIVPYAIKDVYRVLKGLDMARALAEAKRFVAFHYAYAGSVAARRIYNDEGRTVGYEVRPLYQPFVFGMTDILDTDYVLEKDDKTVRAIIRLKPALEIMKRGSDDKDSEGNGGLPAK